MSLPRLYGVFDRYRIPVDDSGLRLGGEPISRYGISLLLGGVEIGEASAVTDFLTVPGRSGSLNRTLLDVSGHAHADRRSITMHVATTGNEPDMWETKTMLGALDGTTTTLEWGTMPGRYEGFLTVGAWTDVYVHGGVYHHSTCDLTMLADPDLIDDARQFRVTTDAVRVNIHGNRPAWPTITTTPPAGTKRLYVTVETRQLVYNLTNADGVRRLVIDCANRSTLYGATPVFPTVDSDYPILTPGVNGAQISAGEATVTYEPRYRI